MLIEEAKIGLTVLINSIEQTKRNFGSNSQMEKMVGRIFRITGLYSRERGVKVNGWSWRVEDLTLLDHFSKEALRKETYPEPQTFDPKDLIL